MEIKYCSLLSVFGTIIAFHVPSTSTMYEEQKYMFYCTQDT